MHIFTSQSGDRIGDLGEMGLLGELKKWAKAFPKVACPSPRGMGDDCAVLPPRTENTKRVVTIDSLIYGKHFDDSVSAKNAGAKLINRNASDIAAMGGVPADAVLALVMSRDVSIHWLKDFYLGMYQACADLGIELSGGDISEAPGQIFSSSLALTGFAENPLLRTGATVGDLIFTTGTLGGSILKKHFSFKPRIEEGRFLASLPAGKITACIDITDGLLKDHAALMPAGTHANFFLDALPISDDAKKLRGDATEHAFCDGEDYELLFCVAPDFREYIESAWKKKFPETQLTCIGEISPGENKKEMFPGHAYEHFKS